MLPGAVSIYVCCGSLLAIGECRHFWAGFGPYLTDAPAVVCQSCCAGSTDLVAMGLLFYKLMYRTP